MNKFKKYTKIFSKLSNIQIIFFVYLIITFFSTFLLLLPISQTGNAKVTFTDAIFTAASAFSDTGLTTLVTATTWSDFGQFIILLLILIGGIGVFALKFFIINIIFKKTISITSRNVLEKERASNNIGELKRTIKSSIIFLFIAILISTIILWIMFYFIKGNFIWESQINGEIEIKDFSAYDPYMNPFLSFKSAIFHSISAINNAGFDILSDSSLYPYYYSYPIQIVFIILLIIGGIGYPVIYDITKYINHKIKGRTDFKFSLFTKISCITYVSVFIFGLIFTLIFELAPSNIPNNNFGGLWESNNNGSDFDKVMCIFFHVFSTRSAGFTTLNNYHSTFSSPTLVIFSIMMFIGAAPSSTAGGIRTTTLAIIIVATWNRFRGIQGVRLFKRKILDETIYSSFIVFVISIFIVFLGTILCFTSFNTSLWVSSNNPKDFADIFFDVCSAFGTTGLTSGVLEQLNTFSKIVLILIMFIGQLGISSTMLVWRKNNPKSNYTYIEEDVIIG